MTLQQLKTSLINVGALPVKEWEVPSKSEPGTFHKVELFAKGKIVCDCIAGAYGRECRHVKEIKEKAVLFILAQVYKNGLLK